MKKNRVYLLSFGCLGAVIFDEKGLAMSTSPIIADMAETYLRCKSYRDSGTVTLQLLGEGCPPGLERQRPFATAFVRPDRFRFEFRSSAPCSEKIRRYVVHASGGIVHTWWDAEPGVCNKDSLSVALAGATGVSGGSAHTVPSLLVPHLVKGSRLTELVELTELADAETAGVACYRVAGRFRHSVQAAEAARREAKRVTGVDLGEMMESPQLLWIEKRRLLLRRIECRTAMGEMVMQTVTLYDPMIDVPIAEDDLQFEPPGGWSVGCQ